MNNMYEYISKHETRIVDVLFESKQSIVCRVVNGTHQKYGIELRYDRSYFYNNYRARKT